MLCVVGEREYQRNKTGKASGTVSSFLGGSKKMHTSNYIWKTKSGIFVLNVFSIKFYYFCLSKRSFREPLIRSVILLTSNNVCDQALL